MAREMRDQIKSGGIWNYRDQKWEEYEITGT